MDTIQRAVALLLKSAVTGQAQTLPRDFRLKDARDYIDKHRIAVPIYEGAVRCGINQADPLMRRLLQITYEQSIRSEKQTQTVQRIFDAFDENNIDYMPVKGCNTKWLYPKPYLRIMGDADILIRTEDYPRIRPLMLELGLREERENDHVYPWRSDVMLIELHKTLVNQRSKDYFAYYNTGWHFAVPSAGKRHDLSPEDTYIFLFVHFAKHYRSSGIGCRHVLDLYVYRRAYPDLDKAYIQEELTKLNLLTFHYNMERTLAVWFEDAPADAVTELITQYIFKCGNWGDWERWALHNQVKAAKKSGTCRHSRLKALMSACFPPPRTLMGLYPTAAKFPVLLPLFWVVRLINLLLFGRDRIRRRTKLLRSISDQNVEAGLQALEAVGLYFDPEML